METRTHRLNGRIHEVKAKVKKVNDVPADRIKHMQTRALTATYQTQQYED